MYFGIWSVERQVSVLLKSDEMIWQTSFREISLMNTLVGAFRGVCLTEKGVGKASPLSQLSIREEMFSGGNCSSESNL